MLPLVRMMGGISGPTQDTICYYAGQDVWYRTNMAEESWTKWTGTIVTVGGAAAPAEGAPYDYASIETAINSTSGDVCFLCHPVDNAVIAAPMYTSGRTLIIKGVSCVAYYGMYIRSPNNNMFDINTTTASTIIFESLYLRSQENWRSAICVGRNNPANVYVNKTRIYGTGDTYMVDFYQGGQPFKGSFTMKNCHVSRGYCTYIDHGDGSGSATADIQYVQYYNNGEGNYSCYSCARAPSPHIYVQSNVEVENYGPNYGDYYVKFGPG